MLEMEDSNASSDQPGDQTRRAPNMSNSEKENLRQIISKYADVIDNKRTDNKTSKLKLDCWRKIAEEFCSSSPVERSWIQLQNYYRTNKNKSAIKKWPNIPWSCVNVTNPDTFFEKATCRLCFIAESGMERIFKHDGNETVVEQIFLMTTVRVTEIDDFDIFICRNCKSFINHWQRFKDQCITNDLTFNEKCASLNTTCNSMIEFEEIFLGDDKSKIGKFPDLEHEEKIPTIKMAETTASSDDTPEQENELLIPVSEIKVEEPTLQLVESIQSNESIKLDESFGKVEMSRPVVPVDLDRKSKSIVTRKRFRIISHKKKKKVVYQKTICMICGVLVVDMKQHLLWHTGIKNHECPVCKKKFFHVSSMEKHLNIHTRAKMYTCDYENCGKEYVHYNGLKAHKETHLSEKKYACKVCGKKLTHRTGLIEHMNIHFSRNIPCPHCVREFKSKGSLSRHIVTHSEEKPFKCDHCSMAFKWKSSVVSHIKTHHRSK